MDNSAAKIENFTYDIIYYLLWIIELVLMLRFVLKIMGANSSNAIIAFVYSISSIFMGVFKGVFGNVSIGNMIIEPSVLLAMVFYAIAAYVIVSLLRIVGQHN